MILISGPCVIENGEKLDKDAAYLAEIVAKYDVDFYFKASCVKDNRTSLSNFRGPGFEKGIKQLVDIHFKHGIKVTTDFHTPEQVNQYASYGKLCI